MFEEMQKEQDYSLLLSLVDMKSMPARAAGSKEAKARYERFRTDIAGFCKYYFPHYIQLDQPEWQRAIFDIFQDVHFNEMGRPYWSVTEDQARRLRELHRPEFRDLPRQMDLLRALVLCAPREQGKSTVFARMLIIWAMLYGYFRFIVLIRSSDEIAAKFLFDTAVEFEDNERLVSDYGDLKGSVWKYGQYSFRNGAVMLSVGRGASIRGLVDREKRPDCIILDDITTDQDKYNIQTLKKIYDWIFSSVVNLGKDAVILALNTIFNSEDPQARMLARIIAGDLDGYLGIRLSAEIVDGEQALWPEYWPIEALKRKCKEIGRERYLVEYQSITPDSMGKTFRPSDFIWVSETAVCADDFYISFGVDPNAEGSDDAAICVLGRHRATGRYLTFELWSKDKGKVNELVDEMVRLYRKYHPYVIGFENVGFQNVYMKLLQEILMPQGLALPLVGVPAPGSKESRATALQPLFENGSWEHSAHIKESPEYPKLLAFPTKGVNDGVVDAMNIAYQAHNRGAGQPVVAAGPRRPSALPGLIGRYING